MPLDSFLRQYRIWLIAGLVILLVLIIGATLLHRSPQEAAPPDTTVSVTSLHSDVLIKEGAEFQLVEGQASAKTGSTIRTSDTGRALIESSAAHRTLIDYSSEIVLTESTGNRTRIGLLGGAVWSRLEKIVDSGEYYEIKSGNAIAAVRGTSFGMWYSGGITTLMVIEGSVGLSAVDSAGQVIPGTEVVLTAGQKAVRDGNGKIVVTAITKEDRALPWVLFNDSEESPGASPAAPVPVIKPAPPGVAPEPSIGEPPQPPSETVVAGPELSLVTPSKIDESSRERITLKGKNLEDVTQVLVGTKKVDFEVLSSTTVTFYADDVDPGRYDVTVSGTAGSDTLSRALTIIEADPAPEPQADDPNSPKP